MCCHLRHSCTNFSTNTIEREETMWCGLEALCATLGAESR